MVRNVALHKPTVDLWQNRTRKFPDGLVIFRDAEDRDIKNPHLPGNLYSGMTDRVPVQFDVSHMDVLRAKAKLEGKPLGTWIVETCLLRRVKGYTKA